MARSPVCVDLRRSRESLGDAMRERFAKARPGRTSQTVIRYTDCPAPRLRAPRVQLVTRVAVCRRNYSASVQIARQKQHLKMCRHHANNDIFMQQLFCRSPIARGLHLIKLIYR